MVAVIVRTGRRSEPRLSGMRAAFPVTSMTAMVSAAGRVFYVMDEGPVASIQLPPEPFLTARDAFNGTVLWKRPLRDWCNPDGPGCVGCQNCFETGQINSIRLRAAPEEGEAIGKVIWTLAYSYRNFRTEPDAVDSPDYMEYTTLRVTALKSQLISTIFIILRELYTHLYKLLYSHGSFAYNRLYNIFMT